MAPDGCILCAGQVITCKQSRTKGSGIILSITPSPFMEEETEAWRREVPTGPPPRAPSLPPLPRMVGFTGHVHTAYPTWGSPITLGPCPDFPD